MWYKVLAECTEGNGALECGALLAMNAPAGDFTHRLQLILFHFKANSRALSQIFAGGCAPQPRLVALGSPARRSGPVLTRKLAIRGAFLYD